MATGFYQATFCLKNDPVKRYMYIHAYNEYDAWDRFEYFLSGKTILDVSESDGTNLKIIPCPVCGEKARIKSVMNYDYVVCDKNKNHRSGFYECSYHAINEWNGVHIC